MEHLRAGRHREAIAICHERLREAPGDTGALVLLARALLLSGQAIPAVLLLERAVKSQPDEPALLAELGSALASAGSTAAAVVTLQRAIAQDPANAEAHFELLDLGAEQELEETLLTAAEANPESPAPHIGLANLLLETRRTNAALACFGRAVELEPGSRQAHARTGSRLAMMKQDERAARVYRWGLALNPGDPVLMHLLSAVEGGQGPERAADDYLAQHFDEFAKTFDDTLVGRLEYRAPQLIVEALEEWLSSSGPAQLSVLDAGCGTGLCGPLLRPYARRLVGVDLSRQMLAVAEASGSYDELRVDEVTRAMEAEPATYDLVVATDVLIYFGRLEEFFAAAARAVHAHGRVAVTAERHDGDGYVLRSSGRYAHAADYLRAAAADAGLVALSIKDCALRLEAGTPVPGYTAVLQRT